jgi:dGTPase
VRGAGETMVRFSPAMAVAEKELKAFLYQHLYRHEEVMRVREDAERIVNDLFDVYFTDPRAMPDGWREGLDRAEDRIKARHVADFLAGMTDTYAIREHQRLFDHTPDLS